MSIKHKWIKAIDELIDRYKDNIMPGSVDTCPLCKLGGEKNTENACNTCIFFSSYGRPDRYCYGCLRMKTYPRSESRYALRIQYLTLLKEYILGMKRWNIETIRQYAEQLDTELYNKTIKI